MTTTKDTATLTIYGDTLTVTWTGSVWQSPCNGTQHARAEDAMREEVEQYLSDCGEDVDAMTDEIGDMLEKIIR